MWGFGLAFNLNQFTKSYLERYTKEGESPVWNNWKGLQVSRVLSLGNEAGIWETLTSNPKYVLNLIAYSIVIES